MSSTPRATRSPPDSCRTFLVLGAPAFSSSPRTAAPSFPDAVQLSFRIGVHLGDVLEKGDGSVYGDGVNIAAGLQALCKPGSVMISQAVHGAIASRIRNGFDDVGEHAVKNIVHRVRAFHFRADGCAKGRSPPHRFGRYAVLPEKRQLLIDGEAAPLDRRAFDLLLALIERRHRVVSRNELADLVGLVEAPRKQQSRRARARAAQAARAERHRYRARARLPVHSRARPKTTRPSFESMPDSPQSASSQPPRTLSPQTLRAALCAADLVRSRKRPCRA